MKACTATGEKRKLVCKEIQEPTLEPGMLLLKTKYACICGSDLEYLDDSLGLSREGITHPGSVFGHKVAEIYGMKNGPVPKHPGIVPGSIPGHEFVAEIIGIGEGVNGWEIGDRVAPGAGLPGVPQPPPKPRLNAGYESSRAFADYILTSPGRVQKVPDSVSDEAAALVEPLGTGVGTALAAELKPGKSVAIIGAGKIGMLSMMCARVWGASPIVMIDIVQSRLDKALELGADAVINAAKEDVIQRVADITGDGANAVIICVRDGKVLNQAAEMGCRGATLVLAGFIPPSEVNPMFWTLKQLKLVGILGGPAGFMGISNLAMYLLEHKQVDPTPLVTEVIPFSDCQRALDSVYSGENIAVLLKP